MKWEDLSTEGLQQILEYQQSKGYADGKAFAQPYKKTNIFGGTTLEETLKRISECIEDSKWGPDITEGVKRVRKAQHAYYLGYQQGFKNVLGES
jgi:hypothetical protein